MYSFPIPGYQKGVLPKYLREKKEIAKEREEEAKACEDHAVCPTGHVALPDVERKETLRMLRNSKIFCTYLNKVSCWRISVQGPRQKKMDFFV